MPSNPLLLLYLAVISNPNKTPCTKKQYKIQNTLHRGFYAFGKNANFVHKVFSEKFNLKFGTMNKRFYTKIFSILLLCLAGLTAFGQQRVYQNYDYSISIVPKGDGPVLENKGINLSLGAPLIDGGTSEVEILVTAAVSDPNISKNDKGIKKSKYKGNIYNVGSPINTISYQIRLNNGSSKSGTVEYPCSMSCAI